MKLTVRFATALVLVLSAGGLSGQATDPASMKALVVRADEKTAPYSYSAVTVMENYGTDSAVTKNEIWFWRKGDRMLAVVKSPQSQKGQALLRNGDNLWMYLPRSGKVTRIGSKEKSLGGEASNTDLLRVDLASDYEQKFLGREEVDGVPCWKLELNAIKRTVSYDRLIYWISVADELPVRREYYSLSGKKLKTMTFGDITDFGGRAVPATVVIVNELNPALRTVSRMKSLKTDATIPESRFSVGWLESGGSQGL